MAQFQEALEGPRLTQTWAPAAEIQALLGGLAEEQIFSETYGRRLNLERWWGSTTCRNQVMTREESAFQGHQGQESSMKGDQVTWGDNFQKTTDLRWRPWLDEHFYDEEMTNLLRGTESRQKPESDSERMDEGNLEDEREWCRTLQEEVEARRVGASVWQHRRDRGWRMSPPAVVPRATSVCEPSEETMREREAAPCPVVNMEEETELTRACRTLDLYTDKFEGKVEDTTTGLDPMGHFPGRVSYVKESGATDPNNNTTTTDWLRSDPDVFWAPNGLMDPTVDPPGDTQSCMDAGFSRSTPQENSLYSSFDHRLTLGVKNDSEMLIRDDTCEQLGCMDGLMDFQDKNRVDSHWDAKMQDVNQDLCMCPELDLPDHLFLQYLSDDLPTIDQDVLFGELLNTEDDNNCISGDIPMATELLGPDAHHQRQEDTPTKTNSRRKRPRAPRKRRSTNENTPSRPKRPRATGRMKPKETQVEPADMQGVDAEPEPSSADLTGLSTSPPRILHLHPSIHFITIPEAQNFQVVQTLGLSPPVIRVPFPKTATPPTFIFVNTAATPCKQPVPPLSPADGAVAPVQMSSSPTGSMSDSASNAMTHPCASPIPPSHDTPCKESPPPQSPTVIDIPQVVKDYIHETKAHMSHTCQQMEAGLSLTSHYVDVRVSQREIPRSGKNTNKFLDKELVLMGQTDRQRSLVEPNQIFEGSNGEKPKRYMLLLGNAGMGKTTLIRKLCLDWSRGCIPQFDFVFLLNGKALTLTEPTYSLQTLLLNLSSLAPPCVDPEAVYAQILAAPKRVLIIFDGFDELRDYETLLQNQEKDFLTSLQKDKKAQTHTVRQLYTAILQKSLLPGCTLLLSTRPRGSASQLLRRTDSLLEVSGFTPTDIETYVSQYFPDTALRASALDCLRKCRYLHLLCWNPGLCRLVCLVLQESKSIEALPQNLTGLCHRVIRLKFEEDRRSTQSNSAPNAQTQVSVQSEEETQTQMSRTSPVKRTQRSSKSRGQACTRSRTTKQKLEQKEVDGEDSKIDSREPDRAGERELLSRLGALAWDGIKANSSILPSGHAVPTSLKAFGQRTGLFSVCCLKTKKAALVCETEGGGRGDEVENRGGDEEEMKRNKERTDAENTDAEENLILLWANPFLQSYLAGVHLALSRSVSDRAFLQTLPFQSGPRGRRRPQRMELELTQRSAVGLLFHSRTELQRLDSCTETAFRDMLVNRQGLVTKHLEGLSYGDMTPAQVLEACQYVFEASSMRGDGSRQSGSSRFVTHLAANLPEVLTFRGVPLNPWDVFAVQTILESAGAQGRSFCVDLEDCGIQISGLRALVGLNNINTYRGCIADVITLWEQLEHSGEVELLQGSVSKLKIEPLKATQVCHTEHLAKLVNIHTQKRLSDSSSQSESIFAEGVPAVKELHKLELELGPDIGPLALPKLWEFLPGLHNLQRLDLENSKIGDQGAEKLADALVSLSALEILNLSQNCIGDAGVKKLATTLRDLPKLHCLSLYSNVISDEGAESLAAVLPHMASLTYLDVKYNKLTDAGAQSLGASLRNCKKMKTLMMWNPCIPYGVFERLQQQDNRIHWH